VKLALLLVAPALLAAPALAQAQVEAVGEPNPAKPQVDRGQEQLAADRGREFMHPDIDPVRVIGNEELDNDFRSRTPRLGTNTEPPVLLDEDQAYLRRLAMFERRASFSSAIPAAPWSEHYVDPGREKLDQGATHPNAEPELDGDDPMGLLLILVGAAALAAVGLQSRR
jgi:hypothetical protein